MTRDEPSSTTSNNQISNSQESSKVQAFIQFFIELNEKAIDSMNKDEPETALEYLKRVDETLRRSETSEDSTMGNIRGSDKRKGSTNR